jgi:hypothetical protein
VPVFRTVPDRRAANIARVRSKRHETDLPRRRKRELVSPQRRAFLEEEFGPRLPSHSIRPGLFSKLCGTLARRRQLGSASSSDKLYTLRCATPYYRTAGADTPHPCQPRTSNPSAAAKFPRRARTLTIFPCSAKPMQILPISDSLAFRTYGSENRLTSGTVNPMVKIRRLVWRGWAQIGETQVQNRGGRGNRARRSPSR